MGSGVNVGGDKDVADILKKRRVEAEMSALETMVTKCRRDGNSQGEKSKPQTDSTPSGDRGNRSCPVLVDVPFLNL